MQILQLFWVLTIQNILSICPLGYSKFILSFWAKFCPIWALFCSGSPVTLAPLLSQHVCSSPVTVRRKTQHRFGSFYFDFSLRSFRFRQISASAVLRRRRVGSNPSCWKLRRLRVTCCENIPKWFPRKMSETVKQYFSGVVKQVIISLFKVLLPLKLQRK